VIFFLEHVLEVSLARPAIKTAEGLAFGDQRLLEAGAGALKRQALAALVHQQCWLGSRNRLCRGVSFIFHADGLWHAAQRLSFFGISTADHGDILGAASAVPGGQMSLAATVSEGDPSAFMWVR
jgi:hypothetical protein